MEITPEIRADLAKMVAEALEAITFAEAEIAECRKRLTKAEGKARKAGNVLFTVQEFLR